MKPVLVFAIASSLAACAHRQPTPRDKPDFGTVIGQSTASGPSDPTQPLARDPDVTEGGGTLSGPVGNAPGGVTPTVGEQPDTLEQAKGPTTTDTSGGQPATVVAPTVVPPGTTTAPSTAPAAPTTPTAPTTPVAPVTGPVTGAGPNGPGTGTGPATPTGPATGAPPPTPPGPTARPIPTPAPR